MDGGSGLWLSTKRRSRLSCMQSRYCLTFRNLKPLLANHGDLVEYSTIPSCFVVLSLHIHGGVERVEGSSSTESSKKQGTKPRLCFPRSKVSACRA